MQSDGENKPGKAGRVATADQEASGEFAGLFRSRMVERLVASGTLTAVKIRGAVRFRSSDIEQIMMKGTT